MLVYPYLEYCLFIKLKKCNQKQSLDSNKKAGLIVVKCGEVIRHLEISVCASADACSEGSNAASVQTFHIKMLIDGLPFGYSCTPKKKILRQLIEVVTRHTVRVYRYSLGYNTFNVHPALQYMLCFIQQLQNYQLPTSIIHFTFSRRYY